MVIAEVERTAYKARRLLCRCDCGVERVVLFCHLRAGKSVSCGCYRPEVSYVKALRHGGCGTPLYGTWRNMINRCCQSRRDDFHVYAGRGISVCPEWRSNFSTFHDWAHANGYRPGLSIDRINNDSNYEPDNCRWATPSEQSRNQRRNHLVTAFGETKCLVDWTRDVRCTVQRQALRRRLQSGMLSEQAITLPAQAKWPVTTLRSLDEAVAFVNGLAEAP